MIIYKKKKGFTLIELLLVITAIGILVSIALVALNPNKQLEAGRAVKRKVDMDIIVKAIERYGVTNSGQYPPALESVVTGGTVGLCVTSPCTGGIDLTTDLAPYISAIPLPQTGQYTITKTATGITPGYDSSTIWATAGTTAPKLDLNFARDKQLVNAVNGSNPITFTRNSIGTYVGSDGLIKTAAVNEPRFDHNPVTRESLGLLVEEGRTNSITNNTMVGAAAGTPGTLPTGWSSWASPTGLTRTVVGSGTVNGINYIDVRFNGTPSSTGEITVYLSPQTTATLAQSWTSSLWLSLAGGSTSNIGFISLRNFELNSGAYVRESSTNFVSSISSSFVRRQHITTSFGASANQIQSVLSVFATAAGTPIDITLRIGMPQLEGGAFATSVIPTTAAAVTRSADVAVITGANFSSWFNASEGTMFAEAIAQPFTATTFPRIVGIDRGDASSNFATIARSNGVNRFEYSVFAPTGQAIGLQPPVTFTANSTVRAAYVYKADDFIAAANGVLSIADTSGSVPTAVTTLGIGMSGAATVHYNGHIRRITYWSTRLSNTVLQSITQ